MSDIPVGTILSVVQLAWTTLQNTLQACGAHHELTQQVRSLHGVLRLIQNDADSLLSRCDNDQKKELKRLTQGCERSLKMLDEVVTKYNGLSGKKGSFVKFFQKIKFGNQEMLDLSKMRIQLGTHMHCLTLWFNIVSSGSQGRVEGHMEIHGSELKAMRRELQGLDAKVHWVAALIQARDREGSIMTSYTDDNTATWRTFRRELVKMKVNSTLLEKHMPLIKRYMIELGNQGKLDEITEESYLEDNIHAIYSNEYESDRGDSKGNDSEDRNSTDDGESLLDDDTPPSITFDFEFSEGQETTVSPFNRCSFKSAYVEDADEMSSAEQPTTTTGPKKADNKSASPQTIPYHAAPSDTVPELITKTPSPYSRTSKRGAQEAVSSVSAPIPVDANYPNTLYTSIDASLNGTGSNPSTGSQFQYFFPQFPSPQALPQFTGATASGYPIQYPAYQPAPTAPTFPFPTSAEPNLSTQNLFQQLFPQLQSPQATGVAASGYPIQYPAYQPAPTTPSFLSTSPLAVFQRNSYGQAVPSSSSTSNGFFPLSTPKPSVPSLLYTSGGDLDTSVPWISSLITRMKDPVHIDELHTILKSHGCTEDELFKVVMKLGTEAGKLYPNGGRVSLGEKKTTKRDKKGKVISTTRKESWWEPGTPTDSTGSGKKGWRKKIK